MTEPVLVLASGSPRRRALLEQLGLSFVTCPAPVDETHRAGEAPADYVLRLARDKARAGGVKRRPPQAVLGADTAVVLGTAILGKPRDRAHALDILRRLSGTDHRVMSAVALWRGPGQPLLSRLSESTVRFRVLGDAELSAYWDTGEPRDKAGAYAIQGRAAVFVSRLQGSYSGVVGLPLFETWELLVEAGIWP